MMLALGVSGEANENLGFTASMFHLFTHAMFKALLFLGAGAVIHAVHSNLMKDMGGLRKKMPITALTFLVACLAISGIPPFAGFFSKDEILAAAYMSNPMYYYVELLVAGITAFYMFRLYFKIFWYENKSYDEKVHEAPWLMTVPLIILAILSMTTGFIPFGDLVTADGMPIHMEMHWNVAIMSIAVAAAGIFFAYRLYAKNRQRPEPESRLYAMVENKFYIDEIYMFITKKIIFGKISTPVAWFDRHIVDGAVNGVAWITNKVSDSIKTMQSGQLQHYLFAFISGAVALFLFILYMIG
jgi:NADH-quinone oxidoreductase subunit L